MKPAASQPDLPLALLLIGAALSQGCSVCDTAKLVSVTEPKVFSRKTDKKASIAAYRAMADEAWATAGVGVPDGCTAADFQWGFREGFADLVYAGGDGEPPPLPPRMYWQVDFRSPEGAAAVRSWFEGYRFGARVAREGGYRDAATVAVSASLLDCTPCGCPDERGCANQSCALDGPVLSPASDEPLPELTHPELVPTPTESDGEAPAAGTLRLPPMPEDVAPPSADLPRRRDARLQSASFDRSGALESPAAAASQPAPAVRRAAAPLSESDARPSRRVIRPAGNNARERDPKDKQPPTRRRNRSAAMFGR